MIPAPLTDAELAELERRYAIELSNPPHLSLVFPPVDWDTWGPRLLATVREMRKREIAR